MAGAHTRSSKNLLLPLFHFVVKLLLFFFFFCGLEKSSILNMAMKLAALMMNWSWY
jgi:hypothetical protein